MRQYALQWHVTIRYLTGGDKDIHLWTTLQVCRVLKRFLG
jgi:hypothetical protein